jgi:hypothetical protein
LLLNKDIPDILNDSSRFVKLLCASGVILKVELVILGNMLGDIIAFVILFEL